MHGKLFGKLWFLGFSCLVLSNISFADSFDLNVSARIKNLITSNQAVLIGVHSRVRGNDNKFFNSRTCSTSTPSRDNHSQVLIPEHMLCMSKYAAVVYQNNGYMPVWSTNQYVLPITQNILKLLQTSDQDGLNPDDYHLFQLQQIYSAINNAQNTDELANNVAKFDIVLTDGVLQYLSDMAYGRTDYKKHFPKWTFARRDIDINTVFFSYLQNANIAQLLQTLRPNTKYYSKLRIKLQLYQQIKASGGFPVIPNGSDLKLGNTGTNVKILQQRLLSSGELHQPINWGVFDEQLRDALSLYQKNNGLKVSGMIEKNTLKTLNISINGRIKTIEFNLDRLRMTALNTNRELILVNIPDYKLTLVDEESSVFTMDAIVGNPKHRSCIVNSQIAYLEINPYWNIPRSIAVKELLPKIILNQSYLKEKDIDTFWVDGTNKLQIDPATVNWNLVDPSIKFPYFFRQNPGNSNALGQIKFIFPNDCGIYLHDTDEPTLFGKKKRALSHGCIRISKPLQLATYLLQDKKSAWNESAIENAILAGKRHVVTLTNPTHILVTYLTAWVNESGMLQFRPDIYGLDKDN